MAAKNLLLGHFCWYDRNEALFNAKFFSTNRTSNLENFVGYRCHTTPRAFRRASHC